MKVLMVGCGAVGQVYGLALQTAGVTLGLLDRAEKTGPLAAAREQGGLALFQVTGPRGKAPVECRLKDYTLVADEAAARQFAPDQIWFTTPSQAYYSDWFRNFLSQVPSRRVVCFTPEGERPEFRLAELGGRVIFGGTTFMAWQGDLQENGGQPRGVHFWRSPLGVPLAGTEAACLEVAALLKPAGFRVTVDKPGSRSQAAVTAVLTAFVAGLELAGWSLRAYRKSRWLEGAAAACGQAVMGQTGKNGAIQRAALSRPVLAACFRLAAVLMPLLFPFDIEGYLHFHYTKTHEQTLWLLKVFIRDGQKRGMAVGEIERLLEAVGG